MNKSYIYNLSKIIRYGKLFAEQRLSSYHTKFPEQSVLMYLSKYNCANQEMIARYFMLDKGTIAKSVHKLEQKGLINRRRNMENRRENILSLSPSGEEMLEQMKLYDQEWSNILFEGLSSEELEHFDRIINHMSANITKALEREQIASK